VRRPFGLDGSDVDDKVLGLGSGEAGDEFHLELCLELQIDNAFFQRFRQRCADFTQEFDAFQRIDHALWDQISGHHICFLQPAWRAGEDGLIGLIEFLATGKQTNRVGNIFVRCGDELQGEAFAVVWIVFADPF
jgi:hypothetical protein